MSWEHQNRISSAEAVATIDDLVEEALRSLEHALDQFPKEVPHRLQDTETRLVALRDELIQRNRRKPEGHDPELRSALQDTNVCLSLVLGTEFPQGGIHRKSLDMAKECLLRVRSLASQIRH
jgi:hypothetical protein